MDGLFVTVNEVTRRPRSKTEVRGLDASQVSVEITSMFSDRAGDIIPLSEMEVGVSHLFVGPDPYNDRKFYGKVTRTSTGMRVE